MNGEEPWEQFCGKQVVKRPGRKVLYVSDLDGTLLRNNQHTSEYTNAVINEMVSRGFCFSYATARSIFTAKLVTSGMDAAFPVIDYNGVSIVENSSQRRLIIKDLGEGAQVLLDELFAAGIYPTVYSIIDGKERFSNLPAKSSKPTLDFIATRNDIRKRLVGTEEELKAGRVFYITCIEEPWKLLPFYERYRKKYHCVYQKDIYSGEQWLEIMAKDATKASALEYLKEKLCCDYIIAFGDGINDLEMFRIADEAYAVENAVPELKAIAAGIIGSNEEDGVAHWLEEHVLGFDTTAAL